MITRLSVTVSLMPGCSLAFAQVCSAVPGSVCLVPSQNAMGTQATTYTMAYPNGTTTMVVPGSNISAMSMSPSMMASGASCPSNMSSDTTCLMNQIALLRNDVKTLQGPVRAAAITSCGSQLVSRMNQLIASEMIFRQQVAANPNLPGAQTTALELTAQAESLNRDIADFSREPSSIPTDQRPFLAADLNTFTVACWTPAQIRFAEYRTNINQAGTAINSRMRPIPGCNPG